MTIEYELRKRNRRLRIALSVSAIINVLIGSSLAVSVRIYLVDSNVQTVISQQNTITNLQQIVLDSNGTIHSLEVEQSRLNVQVSTLSNQVTDLQYKLNEANRRITELELSVVSLSGIIKTEPGTAPKMIHFESQGVKYSVELNGTGWYFLKLPNNQVYKVTVDWESMFKITRNSVAKESPFNLRNSTNTMRQDFSA